MRWIPIYSIVVLGLLCLAPELQAGPTPEQLDRIVELVGSGKSEETRVRAETLLEVYPDNADLKRMLALLPKAGGESAPSMSTGAAAASGGMEGTRAGEEREFGGITMVWCPPGEFLMGSPESEPGRNDDETQHRVTLTRGFWLAKTETTQAQWERVMGNNPSDSKGADLPVEEVSWDDAQGWLQKMNQHHALPEGWKWELPTEAQWEYACRAGTTGPFAGSGKLDEMGWYLENSSGKAHPVGRKKANAWGLHDMHGNVWEWCRDWYGNYPTGVVTDPTGAVSGRGRAGRGGSWYSFLAGFCRSGFRDGSDPVRRDYGLGFRPAAVPAR